MTTEGPKPTQINVGSDLGATRNILIPAANINVLKQKGILRRPATSQTPQKNKNVSYLKDSNPKIGGPGRT